MSELIISVNDRLLDYKDSNSKCYICFIDTYCNSPCECKSNVCNNCFHSLLKNKYIKCSICNRDYDKDVIDRFLSEFQDLVDEENDQEDQENRLNIKYFYIFTLFILITPILGYIFNLMFFNQNQNPFIYSFLNIIIGLLFYLIIIIIKYMVDLLKLFINNMF